METNYSTHIINGTTLIELTPKNVLINSAQDFLDLVMNLPGDRIIFYKENINELFFDLRSGLAGEVLQKAANYSIHLGIVGDFSKYESKALRDFIYESNKSNRIVFVDTVEEAMKRLSH